VLTGETAGSLETIIPGRDGTGRLISWDFNRLTGPDGAPAGVIASGRDISEERSASDVLRTAGQRHRELFENMTSGVAVLEAIHGGNNFIFRELNSAAEEMDRITRPRVIERCVTEIFPGMERALRL
jgi:PAS domain-containing protein